MILDSTSKKISVVLGEVISTTQLDVVASYEDLTTTTFTSGAADTVTNSLTAVDAVVAPAASTQRRVRKLSVYNSDVISHVVKVRYVNGASVRLLVMIALGVGQTLVYSSGTWTVLNSLNAVVLTFDNISDATTVGKALGRASSELVARTAIFAAPYDAIADSGIQINGNMEISQERGLTAFALSGAGTAPSILDQWYMQFLHASAVMTGAQIAPPGSPSFGTAFPMCAQMKATTGGAIGSGSATDLCRIFTQIEGYRFSRLAFGNAAGQPTTIGFWAYATIAGVLTVALTNGAANRSYVSTVTINNAATWEFKTVTIPADQAGTWLTTTGIGATVSFGSLMGTTYRAAALNTWTAGLFLSHATATNFFVSNNNVVCITGVMIVPGSDTPPSSRSTFNRPYDTEFDLCLRYYWRVPITGASQPVTNGQATAATTAEFLMRYPKVMRITPVMVISAAAHFGATTANYTVNNGSGLTQQGQAIPGYSERLSMTGTSGLVAGGASVLQATNASSAMAFSAQM